MRTKEEQIIFQNQSHLIQRYFQDCGISVDLYHIAVGTDIMIEYCMKGHTKEVKQRFDDFQIFIEEQKKKQ